MDKEERIRNLKKLLDALYQTKCALIKLSTTDEELSALTPRLTSIANEFIKIKREIESLTVPSP